MVESIAPDNAEELVEVVRAALASERPLDIQGQGSKRGLGRPAMGTPVSLAGLAGIRFYEPEELVLSAGAGTPLAVIEEALAECRQQLAFEPADYAALLGGPAGAGTIGGLFACNLSGPRRIKAGAARDHLLGARAVTGRGDLVATGGRVVKNVTGYDLCKLLTGSYGTLAVSTELTFKTLPAPEETATVAIAGPERAGLLARLREGVGTPHEVSGAALVPQAAAARSRVAAVRGAGRDLALVRIEGPGPSVAYRAQALAGQLGAGAEVVRLDDEWSRALWREVRDVLLLPAEALLWRVSLPPGAAAGFLQRLEEVLAFEVLLDWAGGLVWLALEGPGEDGGAGAVRAALAPDGGHATLIRAPAALRARVPVFQPQPPALAALSRRVKESFDPTGILGRGRMWEGV